MLNLIDSENILNSDTELYESIENELKSEEQQLLKDLGLIENKIGRVIKTIEIALSLASNCKIAFEKAKEPSIKALLVRTLVKRLYIRDKKIVWVELNKPLDFLCHNRIKKHSIFDLALSGGPDRN